jgi:heat shock protein HtpX
VMEMCVDNPRQGFGELFDTHPSVDERVTALVKFAGGDDTGPVALPPRQSGTDGQPDQSAPAGPWSSAEGEPSDSPSAPGPWSEPAGEDASNSAPAPTSGPWGPSRN